MRKLKPMKNSKNIYGILKYLSKLPVESGETLSQRENMKETFSPSHNMTKYVKSYEKWGK